LRNCHPNLSGRQLRARIASELSFAKRATDKAQVDNMGLLPRYVRDAGVDTCESAYDNFSRLMAIRILRTLQPPCKCHQISWLSKVSLNFRGLLGGSHLLATILHRLIATANSAEMALPSAGSICASATVARNRMIETTARNVNITERVHRFFIV
jgi:hypothetical protein